MNYYRHFKSKPYKYKGLARHSETMENMVIYETLYENPEGKIWVRPEKMFHEEIEKNGKVIPRFEHVPLQVNEHFEIGSEETEAIKPILIKVFGSFDEVGYSSILKLRKNFYLQVAHIENRVVGFKLGYQFDQEIFYSWLGAVVPEYRGLGVAKVLMHNQHEWCKKQGYKRVQTKAKNKWREMIILNLKSGFHIIGSYTDEMGEPKLILEKKL